jgi:hypothetical protein
MIFLSLILVLSLLWEKKINTTVVGRHRERERKRKCIKWAERVRMMIICMRRCLLVKEEIEGKEVKKKKRIDKMVRKRHERIDRNVGEKQKMDRWIIIISRRSHAENKS